MESQRSDRRTTGKLAARPLQAVHTEVNPSIESTEDEMYVYSNFWQTVLFTADKKALDPSIVSVGSGRRDNKVVGGLTSSSGMA